MEEEIFNPAEAAKNIKEDFVDYILSTRYCYSEEIRAKLKKELLATIAKGPFVSITDLFKEGATLKDLEKESKPIYRLSSEFEKLEQGKEKKKLHYIVLYIYTRKRLIEKFAKAGISS